MLANRAPRAILADPPEASSLASQDGTALAGPLRLGPPPSEVSIFGYLFHIPHSRYADESYARPKDQRPGPAGQERPAPSGRAGCPIVLCRKERRDTPASAEVGAIEGSRKLKVERAGGLARGEN
jgi:hypothetical protein